MIIIMIIEILKYVNDMIINIIDDHLSTHKQFNRLEKGILN